MNNEILGHPKGLVILFFTEMWERFSFYGIKALLIFYMTDTIVHGGFGWSKANSLLILGFFQMACYLTAIPGGLLADRWLGQRKSVWIGCLLIMIGNCSLVLPGAIAFFTGLSLIAIGGGFLKPNISTMVGRLYKDGDPRRESAFSIFYMGINVGAFLTGFIVGTIGEVYGWRWGFLASGIGMFLGQSLYIWGQRYLRETDAGVVAQKQIDTPRAPLTPAEKRRIGIIIFSFVIVIVFWTAFEQSGGLLNLYTKESTDRMIGSFEVKTTWFQSLNPLYIVLLSPLMAMLWPWLAKRGKNPSPIIKMGIGTVIQGLGYLFMVAAVMQRDASTSHLSSMVWVALVYLFCTIGELWLSPVSLSFITSTAPKQMTSLIMGLYFSVTGIAQFLAARVGAFAEKGGSEMKVFLGLVIVTTFFGLAQLAFAKKIIRAAQQE